MLEIFWFFKGKSKKRIFLSQASFPSPPPTTNVALHGSLSVLSDILFLLLFLLLYETNVRLSPVTHSMVYASRAFLL